MPAGPSGGIIPASLADTPVDYEALASTGAIMGSGGLVVLDDRDCAVDIARYFLHFTQSESCGKCTFCRVGTKRMLEILERICEGRGVEGDLAALDELSARVKTGSLCGLGQTAPNPVVTTLRYFRDEYEAHIRERRCPGGVVQGADPLPRARQLHRLHVVRAGVPGGGHSGAALHPSRGRRRPVHAVRHVRHGVPRARHRGRVMAETITLTIDGREVAVEPGTTVLAAARGLGIRIPTLCHVDGFPPSSSCFLCAVQVEGRATLSPSCAMPVANGMVVHTDTQDIRASRKMALELLLSDHAGDCIGPCQTGCPARFDIPGFLTRVADGDDRRSAEIASDFLVLPAALGRICPRLCEQRCHRCDSEAALSVGGLHRYAADRDSGVRSALRAA